MSPSLDSCLNDLYEPGNIPADPGQPPTIPAYERDVIAAGVGAMFGVGFTISGNIGEAAGTGSMAAVGDIALAAPPLDGLTATGAWSMSRDLYTAFTGTRFTEISGDVDTVLNQQNPGSPTTRELNCGGASTRPTKVTTPVVGAQFTSADVNFRNATLPLNTFTLADDNAAYFVFSIIIDSVTIAPTSNWAGHILWGDNGGNTGISLFTGVEIRAFAVGGGTAATISGLSTGVPYVVSVRHESGTMYIRVNNGTESSVACGNWNDGNFLIGNGAFGNKFLGQVFEIVTFDVVPNGTIRNALEQNMMDWIGAV